MTDKKQIVLEAIKRAGKPLRPGDVVKLTGLSKEEVSKLINELKKEGKISSPKRCFHTPVGK